MRGDIRRKPPIAFQRTRIFARRCGTPAALVTRCAEASATSSSDAAARSGADRRRLVAVSRRICICATRLLRRTPRRRQPVLGIRRQQWRVVHPWLLRLTFLQSCTAKAISAFCTAHRILTSWLTQAAQLGYQRYRDHRRMFVGGHRQSACRSETTQYPARHRRGIPADRRDQIVLLAPHRAHMDSFDADQPRAPSSQKGTTIFRSTI